MEAKPLLKRDGPSSRLVAVVASPAALARAIRLRRPPDFFELRLDALRDSLGAVARAIPRLRAPLILTARHPREGGLGKLTPGARRELLHSFLESASLVDIELRSVRQMTNLLDEIRFRKIGLIISHHDLRHTPSRDTLRRLTKAAAAFQPALFKIATRTNTPAELARLVALVAETKRARFPIAAMGIGKLGLESRKRLDRIGSALTYVSLGEANVRGQPTLGQLRRARRAYIR
jgi:3-dehydroquinate dehydratase I